MTLAPYISESFDGIIWRLEIDHQKQLLLIETRSESDKKVAFTSISLHTGEIHFKNLQTEERWLTGMEGACNGVLLIHQFESGNTPVHKGLIAIDGETGLVLWRNYNYALDHLTINGPAVFDTRFQPKKIFLIDTINGATLRRYEASVDLEPETGISVPQLIPISHLNLKLLPESYNNVAHYMENNSYRIVSLHTFFDGRLEQRLYIVKGDEMVYEDLLNTDIQKLQPEAFVMHNNQLIYIKNKTEVKVVSL